MKILSSAEKKKILKILNQQFGINKLPYLLIKFGKEKIRVYSGMFSREELNVLDKNLRIESLGLYLGKFQQQEFRLSLDAIHVLKNQITKNILEINEKQAEFWFKGQDIKLENETPRDFFILKHKEDFIGCGKSIGFIIKNYMPKERRAKS